MTYISKRPFGLSEDELYVEEVPVSTIAAEYGTPSYVYSKNRIIEKFKIFSEAFSVFESRNVFYAIKACNNPHIAKILVDEGAGIDAASPNEILLALHLGVEPENIIFSGNNLTQADIQFAVDAGVHFNVDDHGILDQIFAYKPPKSICFRVNVGSEDDAGMLNFSGDQSKFGILPKYISGCVHRAKSHGIKNISLHMMPGSCRLDSDYFVANAETLSKIAIAASSENDVELTFLDLGGGIGIPYDSSDQDIDLEKTFREVRATIDGVFEKASMKVPKIVMEPARYFVGDAGILLGRVQAIKNAANVIIGTDLSMNVMVRKVLYDADHRIDINQKSNDETLAAGFCGQVCENTDYTYKEHQFPTTVEKGDLVIMYDVGAYGYSMAYDYNGRVTPAEVLVDSEKHNLIRRRKSYRDTLSLVEGDQWKSDLKRDTVDSAQRNGIEI